MSRNDVLTDLLGLQGWEADTAGIRMDGDTVTVPIRRQCGHGYECSRCGERLLACYDHQPKRLVRDLPVWGRRCFLEFIPVRVDCPRCRKVTAERLEWVESHQRMTLRYELYAARLCGILPALDVAALEGLGKDAVYRLDRKWLLRREAKREPRPVRRLGIDEIALRKGQCYATVFYDLERREVIGMVKGRRQRQVSGFFRRWGKERCRQVEVVCMDMWSAYANSVRIHLKKADIVFDKFHIYSYLSVAIDTVRRGEQNNASKEGKQLIKGSRWLWLKKREGLKRRQKRTLQEIMAANGNLQKAYLLKEDFERFYESADAQEAEAFLEEWSGRCKESGLQPFARVAQRLLRRTKGVLAYFKHKITNAVSEGINNKIKVLKRRAYGFHDMEYFRLKIMDITGNLPPIEAVAHSYPE